MVSVYKLRKNQLVSVNVEFFDRKVVVLFGTKRETYIPLGMFLNISTSKGKRLSFQNEEPISLLGVGRGISVHLLACSLTFREPRNLFNRTIISLLDVDISPLRIYRCWIYISQNWNNSLTSLFLLEPQLSRTMR